MIDTMTGTKVVGAACGSLLFLLLVQWASESLYHVHGEHEGVVEMAAASVNFAEDVVEVAVDFSEVLATADPAKGERVFAKCKACHKLEVGDNSVGPTLHNVIDRAVGVIEGFAYSVPMENFGGEWTIDNLNEFLVNPRKYMPGTKMSFAGLKKDKDRANLISYLTSLTE